MAQSTRNRGPPMRAARAGPSHEEGSMYTLHVKTAPGMSFTLTYFTVVRLDNPQGCALPLFSQN